MKTSLSLLVCLAALPLFAPAQTTPTVPSVPDPSSEGLGSNWLVQASPPPAMTLRTPEPSPGSNALSEYTTWQGPKSEVLIEQRSPQVSLGRHHVPVSGFLVDLFRPTPDSENAPTVAQKIMGRPTSVRPTAEQPAFSWRDDYLKWGESNAPWSVVSAAPPLQPVSVLFQTHH